MKDHHHASPIKNSTNTVQEEYFMMKTCLSFTSVNNLIMSISNSLCIFRLVVMRNREKLKYTEDHFNGNLKFRMKSLFIVWLLCIVAGLCIIDNQPEIHCTTEAIEITILVSVLLV